MWPKSYDTYSRHLCRMIKIIITMNTLVYESISYKRVISDFPRNLAATCSVNSVLWNIRKRHSSQSTRGFQEFIDVQSTNSFNRLRRSSFFNHIPRYSVNTNVDRERERSHTNNMLSQTRMTIIILKYIKKSFDLTTIIYK